MASASGTSDLNAAHPEAIVLVFLDDFRVGWNHETWPAAAGIEFGSAHEQEGATSGTVVIAGVVILGEGTGEGPFGGFLTQNPILLRGEESAPLGLATLNLLRRFTHG